MKPGGDQAERRYSKWHKRSESSHYLNHHLVTKLIEAGLIIDMINHIVFSLHCNEILPPAAPSKEELSDL